MRDHLHEAKGTLKKEQLERADIENTFQQLEKDLKFKVSVLEKELEEV